MADSINLGIREARLSDVDSLVRLWTLYLNEQGALDPKLQPSEDSEDRFRADVPEWIHDSTRIFLVACADDVVVGFLSGSLWSLPPIFDARLELFLEFVFVDSDYRRLGAGRGLFQGAVQRSAAWGVERVRLSVSEENDVGKEFWVSLGGRTAAREIVIPVESGSKTQERRPLGFAGNR